MNNNYQKMFYDITAGLNSKPRLLLHACCAPCSSYVLEKLESIFSVTIYFFNPNIAPQGEYNRRLDELKSFLKATGRSASVPLIETEYQHQFFLDQISGLEQEKEGGKRCYACYKMRLAEIMKHGIACSFDYFTTTLSISPYKNAEWINHLGLEMAKNSAIKFLPADFKKNNGYLRSLEISRQNGLYRQDYCGCEFSFRK